MFPEVLKEAIIGLTTKFVFSAAPSDHTIGSLKFNTDQCVFLAELGFHQLRDYITCPLSLANIFMRHLPKDDDFGDVSQILPARWLKHGRGPQIIIAGNVLLLVVFKYRSKTDYSLEQIEYQMYLEEACSYSLLEEFFARRNMIFAAELQIEVTKVQNSQTDVKFNFGRKIRREWVGGYGVDLKHAMYMKYLRAKTSDLVQTKFVHHNRLDKLLPERLQNIDFKRNDEEYYKDKIQELSKTTPFIANLVERISKKSTAADKIRFLLEFTCFSAGPSLTTAISNLTIKIS